jgi:O-antigen/teichoic acid export membrane protein
MTATPIVTGPTLLRQFVSGVGWSMAATVGERGIGLLQSMLIARVLGIEDYGRYGLLFVTVGWISSVAGMQLGLTTTVEVARYRDNDPTRAVAVIRLSELMTLGSVAIVAAVMWSRPETFGAALLSGSGYGGVMALAGLMAAIGVLTGIQDSVVQGYEDFKALAAVRTVGAAVGFLLVITLGRSGGLGAVVLALTLGGILRFAMVLFVKEYRLRRHIADLSWQQIWQAHDVLWSFSLPSVLASAISGAVVWFGTILLSGIKDGFQDVAVVTVANQWRGMLLLATTILSSVAIPMLTRLGQQGDTAAIARLHGYNKKANLAFNIVVFSIVSAASQPILRAYGREFGHGWPVFVLIVATAIPTAYSNVLLQYLVSQRRMWQQLAYYLLSSVALLIAYWFAIAAWGVVGFATATLAVAIVSAFVLDRLLTSELRNKMP